MSNGTAFLRKLLSDRGLTQSFPSTQNSPCALKVIQGVNSTFFFFSESSNSRFFPVTHKFNYPLFGCNLNKINIILHDKINVT